MTLQQPTQYVFDRFTVDAHRRLLFASGVDGAIDLPPRALDALIYMVQRPGELLTKAQLMDALWPDVVVEENSLTQTVSALRKILGERPSEHRYIVTAPGRGYRFVAAVRAIDTMSAQPADQALSIAVLPFADRTGDVNSRYLGDALAADLARLLSARSRIMVAAYASSAAFKDSHIDKSVIAHKLNVARLLEGRIDSDGTELVVTASMLDQSGQCLWTITMRRHPHGISELQGDLAREIARALDPTAIFGAETLARADPEAYLAYLQALSLSMRPSQEGVTTSITLLRKALDIQPLFPRARSLLAIQLTACVMFGFPPADALVQARHEVASALDLDDQNGETHCAAGVIDCLIGSWCRAEERFRIAHSLTSDPLVSGLRCAYLTHSVGQLERARQQAELALRIAPTHPIGARVLSFIHQSLGRDDQALRYAQLAIALGQSASLTPLVDLFGQLHLRAGREDEARQHMLSTLPPRLRTPGQQACMALLCSACRNPALAADATAALAELERLLAPGELDPPMRKRLILWYTRLGALDAAFDLAERSLDVHAREEHVGGAWGVLWVPEMQPFRDDERFQHFASRLRLIEYWSEYGPPDGYALSGSRLLAVVGQLPGKR